MTEPTRVPPATLNELSNDLLEQLRHLNPGDSLIILQQMAVSILRSLPQPDIAAYMMIHLRCIAAGTMVLGYDDVDVEATLTTKRVPPRQPPTA